MNVDKERLFNLIKKMKKSSKKCSDLETTDIESDISSEDSSNLNIDSDDEEIFSSELVSDDESEDDTNNKEITSSPGLLKDVEENQESDSEDKK